MSLALLDEVVSRQSQAHARHCAVLYTVSNFVVAKLSRSSEMKLREASRLLSLQEGVNKNGSQRINLKVQQTISDYYARPCFNFDVYYLPISLQWIRQIADHR